ncbi:MAG: DMT family transporter [Burkholderiales bacterium]
MSEAAGLSAPVTLAVLGAALLHAAWNAMIKGSSDPALDLAGVVGGGALVAVPFLLFVPLPAPESWPYLAASVAIHIGYFVALVATYRAGDLSHGYPLMRGIAPLLVAGFGVLMLGEIPGAWMWAGIMLISAGVIGISFAGGGSWLHNRRATAWALANAVIIATYTLVDGAGVRLSGRAESYALWIFFLDGFPYVLMVAWGRRGELLHYAGRYWVRGLVGGAGSVVAYGIALWAMTRAPIAAIAALRETSVIFAALLGAWLLKEPFGARRIAGALAVAAGVIALKA